MPVTETRPDATADLEGERVDKLIEALIEAVIGTREFCQDDFALA